MSPSKPNTQDSCGYWIVSKSGCGWSPEIFQETSGSSVTVLKTGLCHVTAHTDPWGSNRAAPGILEDPRIEGSPRHPHFPLFLSYLRKLFNSSESLFSITQVIPTLKDNVKLQGGVISGFTVWNGPSGVFVFFLSSSLLFYFLSAACLWRNKM